jgi:hypothetical protein
VVARRRGETVNVLEWWPDELRATDVASDVKQILLLDEGLPMIEWPAHSVWRIVSTLASLCERSRSLA